MSFFGVVALHWLPVQCDINHTVDMDQVGSCQDEGIARVGPPVEEVVFVFRWLR
jgi:hypothetical protein